jgi:hypothetical protein
MRRLPEFLVAIAAAVVGTSLAAEAAFYPTPVLPAWETTDALLLANRLRGRASFRVRSSRYRVGAFARGDCPVGTQENLRAIVPVPNAAGTMGETPTSATNPDDRATATATELINQLGIATIPAYLGAAAHPVFLMHVPALPNATGVLFVDIPDKSLTERQQYKVAFDLPDEAGIIGVRIPDAAPALQEGPVYRWRVSIECSPENDEDDVVAFSSAAFEQVPDLAGTEDERLDYYLESGIWQDTAAMLAANRYDNPDADADAEWATLMEVSGLSQFADTPIISIQEGRLIED